jgi:hypothetical protein
MRLTSWIAATLLLAVEQEAAERQSSPQARRALSAAAGQALQGNMDRALVELGSVPAADFGTRDAAVRACMIERFRNDADGSLPVEYGPLAGRAIGMFRSYWRAALLTSEARGIEEERLYRNLARLAGLPPDAEHDRIEERLRARFAQDGLHLLMGRTPPLLELMIWRSETVEQRAIALPEGDYRVTVRILDDFASLGWSAYATCDRSFTGGWVTADGINAVRPGWANLEDENFRVSFLAHEAQHFADRERFGELASWELEYRGKLTELALADMTLSRLLTAFASNQGDDPAVPHSYANRRVLAELRGRLELDPASDLRTLSATVINQAARNLLIRDSERRSGG